MTLRSAIRRFWKSRGNKKPPLKIQFEFLYPGEYYLCPSRIGHMTLTGGAGRLTSLSDPSDPYLRSLELMHLLDRIVDGLERLLSDESIPLERFLEVGVYIHGPEAEGVPLVVSTEEKTIFLLRTVFCCSNLMAWFVKKADGTIVVRSLPESDDRKDALLDKDTFDRYRAMYEAYPGDSYGGIVSELNGEELTQAVVESLIELAEIEERAVERKDEDGYHESLISYMLLQSYIARCLEWLNYSLNGGGEGGLHV